MFLNVDFISPYLIGSPAYICGDVPFIGFETF